MEYYITWFALPQLASIVPVRLSLPAGHRIHTYIKEAAGQIQVLVEVNPYKEVETRAS